MAAQEIGAAPSFAAELVELVESDGVGALAGALGVTRRQADQVVTLARRALREGRDLEPDELPTGTVHAAVRRQRATAAPPAPTAHAVEVGRILGRLDALDDARTRPSADQLAAQAEVGRLEALADRNRRAGYPVEWDLTAQLDRARQRAGHR
jgi:hypothetical protein